MLGGQKTDREPGEGKSVFLIRNTYRNPWFEWGGRVDFLGIRDPRPRGRFHCCPCVLFGLGVQKSKEALFSSGFIGVPCFLNISNLLEIEFPNGNTGTIINEALK